MNGNDHVDQIMLVSPPPVVRTHASVHF